MRNSPSAWHWCCTARTGTADRPVRTARHAGPPGSTTPPRPRQPAWPGCCSPGHWSAPAAATAVDADLSTLADWLALTGYCLLATLSLIVMEMYVVWAPTVANARLNALRSWLAQHQEQLIVTLALLLGLWLTARSIAELVA